ncbi:MAG TPA: hypothetical protein EYQ83_02245, partial [Acidobacteria bacterium]|nr:hypothetical protein [Acidobacteriota bacterium]
MTSSQCQTVRGRPIQFVVVLTTALVVASCAGSPTAPSDTPSSVVATSAAMAPPPAGVSAEVWRAFFVISGDTRRHRLVAEDGGHPYEVVLEAFLQ